MFGPGFFSTICVGCACKALRGFSVLLVVLGLSTSAWAKRDFGPHSGYVDIVDRVREEQIEEVVLLQAPSDPGATLQEKIFNDKLIREFRERYEEKFGRTEVERAYNSPNRFTYYDDLYGFKGTAEQMNDERRRYADFVTRRLLEYHIDNYAQNDPKVRPVWEAKERLKEIRVEVASFRFDMQYSIAGNTFDLKMANPYLTLTRVRLQMDPGQFGPGSVDETIVSIGRPLTDTIFTEGHYALTDGIVSFIGRRALTPALNSTLTVSTFTRSTGTSKRESKYLAGLAFIF